MRVLLVSLLVSSLEAGASERGVEARPPLPPPALPGRLARLVSGARDVKAVGGVSSRLIGCSDFTGVLLAK